MRKNYETMDVDKIQERWSVVSVLLYQFGADCCSLGAVVMSPGFSENDGKSYSKISAT
jgi:hypothetical protein